MQLFSVIFNWLHSPDTVWKLQKFFGVQKKNNSDKDKNLVVHDINNFFFYYLFKFGSLLGQEEFYSLLFPFWFWNLDPGTGRKLMFIWMFGMYVGQSLKDYLRRPRPKSPPVVHLETIYLNEFGLPSTHAIVGVCIPFCAVHFEKERCQIPATAAVAFAACWATLVCISRIYMGMHTFIEVLAGLSISLSVMSLFIPYADWLDSWYMESWIGPAVILILCLLSAYNYPRLDNKFTPAWGDSVAILASTSGVLFGSWAEYQTGFVDDYVGNDCLLMWPKSSYAFFVMVAKTLAGLFVILTIKEMTKIIFYRLLRVLYKAESVADLKRAKQYTVELPAKFLSYYVVGIQVFLTPVIFNLIKSAVM